MKRTQFLAICMAGLLLLSTGCSAKGSASPSEQMNDSMTGGGTADYGEVGNEGFPIAPNGGREDSPVYQNTGTKLIRRAELSIQTTEFDEAGKKLDELVLSHNGYYESASVYGGSYRDANANRSAEYVIRIPSEQFRAFQSSVGSLGHVTASTESSEDVGEQYYDVEARLTTQRIKQERLLSLLEKADTMENIISLENALSETEYQIEQLSSTLNRYDALISYATFRISLSEVVKVTQEVGETASLGAKLSAGLKASAEGLVSGFQNLIIWISYHIFGVVFVLAAAGAGGAAALRKGTLVRKKKVKESGKDKAEPPQNMD